MKKEKIKFKIQELRGTAKSFESGLMRMSFKVKINDNRMKTPYSCPVLFNHERITKQTLIADIITDYIESARYCSSFNHFENPTDYQDFADSFGYEKIGEIIQVVNQLKRCNRLLNSLILTEKDRDLIDDYKDDEDTNIDKISALIKKHFDVLFISHYIKK